MSAPYDDVIGQDEAVAQLREAARSPVHAYLLLGPPGTGKRQAALSFAASLLCPGGDAGGGEDPLVAGSHPPLVVPERAGPVLTPHAARGVGRPAWRGPLRGPPQVARL